MGVLLLSEPPPLDGSRMRTVSQTRSTSLVGVLTVATMATSTPCSGTATNTVTATVGVGQYPHAIPANRAGTEVHVA